MKSIYLKTMVWAAVILVVCLALFIAIARYRAFDLWQEGAPLGKLMVAQFEGAIQAYERGGPESLSSYIRNLERAYPTNRYYLLINGADVRTNSDLLELKRQAGSRLYRLQLGRPVVISRSSTDGRYTFILSSSAPASLFATYATYYLVLLLAVGVLFWVLMFQFASPLNELTKVVRSFGEGGLTARVHAVRRDSIGDLGRAFNQMADRIQALLAVERQLLQDISHELRSPLARLSVAAELTRNSEERDAAISQIHKEVDRLTELLEGLIQITHANNGTGTQLLNDVGLDGLIHELIEDCAIEAAARGCKLQLDCSTGLTLLADRELLRRAIENLLRNAIRYSPAGSTIEIVISGTESTASISVRDYGPGVPKAALAYIFDPFFRVDGSRDMETGGMGLGLSITQRAIHLHHGEIWAENANPGLRVYMHLPLKASNPALQN